MDLLFNKLIKPPKLLLFFSLAFLLAGIFISPKLLINIGVMKVSLTSEIGNVKSIAEMEVIIFRAIMLILSILFFSIIFNWENITKSKYVKLIDSIEIPPYYNSSSLFNRINVIGVISFITLSIYIIFGRYIFSEETLYLLNEEDGFIEYSTAIFFLISSILALKIGLSSNFHKSSKIMHLFFSFVFFVISGEEISWGQRIFGIATIEALQGVNVQNENNLHNLLGYSADHLAILCVFLYGTVLPLIMKLYPTVKKWIFHTGIPVPSFHLAFGFLLASLVHDWTIEPIIPKLTGLRYAEARELLTSIMFLLVMLESFRKNKFRSSAM